MAFRARNRHKAVAFAQQPRESHLAWLGSDGVRNVPHNLNRIHARIEIHAMEARIERARVPRFIVLRAPDVTREEPPTKRRERDETDPESLRRRVDSLTPGYALVPGLLTAIITYALTRLKSWG